MPVLASPIGDNIKVTKNGNNGFLCGSQNEFKARIIEFNEMDDREYRKYVENALKASVDHKINKYCKMLIDHFG